MASYTPNSYVEAMADEFDLFSDPPMFTSVTKRYYMTYRPTSQITTDSSPIEFNVSGQGVDYMDLKHTQIHVKAKILKSDGSALAATEKTAPINLWLQSLFSQVDISLNGSLITNSSSLYPYKSYLKVLLNETNDAKTSTLQSQLYYKDAGGHMDEIDPNAQNQALFTRYVYVKESHIVDMCGPLYEDFADSKRYLINGVNLHIRLFRTRPEFNLMSGEDNASYKVKIEDVYLRVCKIQPNVSMITSHAKMLKHNTVKYPFTKSDVKAVSLTKGQLNYTVDNLFQNKVPNKIVVGLVSAEAFNGSYAKNPFNFAMYKLRSIGLYVDGEPLPGEPLVISDDQYIGAYNNLFEGRESTGSNIDRDDFIGGYALYQFCLEPHMKEGYLDLIKRGNLRLQIQFSEALPETVNCLLYSEDNLLIEIDEARNILYTTP